MHYCLPGLIAVLVVLGSMSRAWSAQTTGGIQAENLLCEHLVDPLGIDATHPRLGWSLRATAAEQRGQVQTAYQILVASSESQLAADRGDVWDSGKVAADRCAEIVYAGRRLESCQRCCWKVRVWDKDDAASEWSPAASWSMGILDPSAWQAKWLGYTKMPPADPATVLPTLTLHGSTWIWLHENDPRKNAPAGTRYFRKTLTLPDKCCWAGIVLSVDDQFVLFVNGRQVGKSNGQEGAWRTPQRYEFGRLLTSGRNVIAVEAENTAEGPAGLIASCKVELDNGSDLAILSDSSWLSHKSPKADKPLAAVWNKPDFDDSTWAKSQELGQIGVAPWDKAFAGPRGEWPQKAPSPLFRKTFDVAKPLARATATICGLGYYELRLNGGKVGERVLDPVFTRYDKRVLYATHDVTAQVVQGKNAVGVMLGNGFYNPIARDAWYFEKAPWRGDPVMLMQLRLEYADGTNEIVASDATWRASTGPVTHDGIRHGEDYDARLEMPGWDTALFDDSSWAEAKVVAGPKGALRAEMMPPNRVTQTIVPIAMTEPKRGVFVFDMGQNFAGWAQLRVSGPAGTTVKLRYAERVLADGSLDQEISGPYVFEGPFQTNTYTLKGQGEEVWEPRFAYHGFRWVEVTGFPGKPTLDCLYGRVVHTAFTRAGSFACSNELLNKIQQMTLWSYRSNFVGYPTDCPHREKNGWTGDAHLAAEQAMYNFYNIAAYETWINSLKDEQRPSGELPGIVPTSGWGYAWGNGPAWDSAYLLIPWYAYQYYGDVGILEEQYDHLKLYVDYLTRRAKNHIVDIGLGDWVPAKTETPVAVTSTGYYYVDSLIVSKIAKLLGKGADAKKYADLANEIRRAFNQTFCGKDGTVANNSQTALSCAIYQGLAMPDSRQAILAQLVTNVEHHDNHLDTGIPSAHAHRPRPDRRRLSHRHANHAAQLRRLDSTGSDHALGGLERRIFAQPRHVWRY
jgi:alpha-L-rhamnosidase